LVESKETAEGKGRKRPGSNRTAHHVISISDIFLLRKARRKRESNPRFRGSGQKRRMQRLTSGKNGKLWQGKRGVGKKTEKEGGHPLTKTKESDQKSVIEEIRGEYHQ